MRSDSRNLCLVLLLGVVCTFPITSLRAQTYLEDERAAFKEAADKGYDSEIKRIAEGRKPQYPLDSDCASGGAEQQLGGSSDCSGGSSAADLAPIRNNFAVNSVGGRNVSAEAVPSMPVKEVSCAIVQSDVPAKTGFSETSTAARENPYLSTFYNGLVYEGDAKGDTAHITHLVSAVQGVVTQAFQMISGFGAAGAGSGNVESVCMGNKLQKGICSGIKANNNTAKQGFNNQKASWARPRDGQKSIRKADPTPEENQGKIKPGQDPQKSGSCGSSPETALSGRCSG